MKRLAPLSFWQTTLWLSLAITSTVLLASLLRCWRLGIVLYRSDWSILLAAYAAVLAGGLWLARHLRSDGPKTFLSTLELTSLRSVPWRLAGGLLFLGIVLLIPWLKVTFQFGEQPRQSTQDPLLSLLFYYWLVWWLVLLAAGALKIAMQTSWGWAFSAAATLIGITCELLIRAHAITAYPFSLGWSETSRYYYASLYFSERLYGERLPLSTLHPTRYLLQSLAFLVPQAGLTWHRIWQFLLWILLSAGTSLALARRLWQSQLRLGWLFAGWFFLFTLRVGVYYHLQVMVLLILMAVSLQRPWRSLAAVLLASAWAGWSRINWVPVPAMIAISIYLLEQPVADALPPAKISQARAIFSYVKQPLIWAVLGCATAILAQLAYIPLSGNAENARAFTSSFTSDLIWKRLWPNDSFALGVLPAIMIISSPLLLAIYYALRGQVRNLHWIRLTGLFSMIALLFVGGLLVSTKIGGGADLHNMDAYAILLGVSAAYLLFGKAKGEAVSTTWGTPPWSVGAVSLLVLLAFMLPALHPFPNYNIQRHEHMLERLREQVETYAQKGPVLFISERHLVTFKHIEVPLVPDYENVTLMEMAMSGNQAYLERFYTDLENHRFAAIVAGKQNRVIMTAGAFAEENNIWNTRVSPYILCYYQEAASVPAKIGQIVIYTPRSDPSCPSLLPGPPTVIP